MVINISSVLVQYNDGGFLPALILLTQGCYHWGTRKIQCSGFVFIAHEIVYYYYLPCVMVYYIVSVLFLLFFSVVPPW